MLNEPDLRRILYMKNLVLEDDQNTWGWRSVSEQIGPEIRKESDDKVHFFSKWSQKLQQRLEARHRIQLTPQFQTTPFSKPTVAAILAIAFLIGLVSNYFGSKTEVNLWLNPFTAFLFWNLGIYLFLLASWSMKPRSLSAKSPLSPWLTKIINLLAEKFQKHSHIASKNLKVTQRLAQTQAAFRKDWFQHFREHHTARLAMYLHWIAIALTLGIISGMYFRGFASAYQFTWDSTFISPESREFWVNLLFGPVVWIARPIFLGGLPAFEANNGAAWIHLFAGAALLYILLPRLFLALLARHQLKQLQKNMQLPFHDPVWHNLYLEADLKQTPIHLVLYSYSPDEKQLDRLIGKSRKALPGTHQKGSQFAISWGETQLESVRDVEPGLVIVLFNGAQTPEDEVHGEFCKDLLQQLMGSPNDWGLLFMVDSQKVSPERQSQRQTAWAQLFHHHEVQQFAWVSLRDLETAGLPPSIRDVVIRFSV